MPELLLGLLLLVAILIAGRLYVDADPVALARQMKRVGGVVALACAFGLLITGRGVLLALPLAGFGLWLLGKRMPWPLGDSGWTQTDRVTSVRTAMLEMSLDHTSGATDGRVLAGQYAGRALSQLSRDELAVLLQECTRTDSQGAQLLRAYIERLGFAQEQAGGGSGGGNGGAGRGPSGMSVDEAYDVLGLRPGATQDEIQQAHRTLMKKNHPDQGGSTYLASKINEAKDVLLRHV